MRVWVDTAGDDEFAGGVDDAAGVGRQRAGRRDGDDALALDTDVPGAHALWRHDLSTADHEIEHGVVSLLVLEEDHTEWRRRIVRFRRRAPCRMIVPA